MLIFIAWSLCAQDKVPPAEATRIFAIKYADARQLMSLIQVFGVKVSYDDRANVIAVHGARETLDSIADVIKSLDVPRKIQNVELTAYLLLATEKGPPGPVPPAVLEPVLKQLRGIFQYKDYRLLDTAYLRVRDGESVSTAGSLAGERLDLPNYSIFINRVRVSPDEKDASVRLEQLNLELFNPNAPKPTSAKIRTDIDIREGQKVVVGKASLTSAQDAVIMVIAAKLVN